MKITFSEEALGEGGATYVLDLMADAELAVEVILKNGEVHAGTLVRVGSLEENTVFVDPNGVLHPTDPDVVEAEYALEDIEEVKYL